MKTNHCSDIKWENTICHPLGDDMIKKHQNNLCDDIRIDIKAKDVVYDGHFKMIKYRFKHRLFSGDWSDVIERELFERGDGAAILLYDPIADKIILIEQIRVGAIASNSSPWQFEIVAGVIDEGQSAAEVAIREAQEEAGLEVQALFPILSFLPSPGGCSERIYLYLGIVDSSKAQGVHGLISEGEDILVHSALREDVMQWLAQGKIENAMSIIALQWLALHVDTKRSKWCDL